MNKISPRLRTALNRQRREMFAEAQLGYLAWESEALGLVRDHDDRNLTRAAVRSTWLGWAGEPPDHWPDQMPQLVAAAVESLAKGIAEERGRAAWMSDEFMRRTIMTIQRCSFWHISPRSATKMLCRVEELGHHGGFQ